MATEFFYDADAKRIRKTQGSSSTLYFGTDFEVINNASTLYVFAGNLRIAKMTDTATEYYHKDHLGSTNAISGADGIVLATGEYLPYGSDRSVNALLNRSPYKYTDQEQDAGTGLYNYDARLYDPVLGQFVMADTIVPEPFNPQSLNRYAYCLNNPVRYVDPDGHSYDSFGPGGKADFGEKASNFGTSGYDAQAANDGWAQNNNPANSLTEKNKEEEKLKEIQNRLKINYVQYCLDRLFDGKINDPLDLATHIVKFTQTDLNFPDKVNPNWSGLDIWGDQKYAGMFNCLTRSLNIDMDYYNKKPDPKGLLDTVIHEIQHNNQTFDDCMKDSRDPYHKDSGIYEKTEERVKDLMNGIYH